MKQFLHKNSIIHFLIFGQLNNVFLTYPLPKHREQLPLPIPVQVNMAFNQAIPYLSHIVQLFVYSNIHYLCFIS
jgi:hypothetical protein